MIRFGDALVLATTKIRSHKIRTAITIVVSSLLFAVLVAAVLVMQGITNSVTTFNKVGLNDRYLVAAQGTGSAFLSLGDNVLTNKQVIAEAKQNQQTLITQKTARAKELGIMYNPATEPAVSSIAASFPGEPPQPERLSTDAPAAVQAWRHYIAAHPSPSSLANLKKIAAPYHPKNFYSVTSTALASGGTVSIMPNGQESFAPDPTGSELQKTNFYTIAYPFLASPELTESYLFSNLSLQKGAIPIVVTYSTAEKLLGLPALSKNASPTQQLAQIKSLYQKAQFSLVTTCYRNSVSSQQISTAESQATESATNKDNKNYQKPNLMYGLPAANSCAQAPVVSDTRTSSEKKQQVAEDEFNADFGQVVIPVQRKLVFQIVGLSPDAPSGGPQLSVNGLLSQVVGSSIGASNQSLIPENLLAKQSNGAELKKFFTSQISLNPLTDISTDYFVEFSDGSDARNFITKQTCVTKEIGICTTNEKPFQLIAYGNNSVALQDLQQKVFKVLALATGIVVLLGAIIMSSMIGRTIADGRKETAVFRALGAKRADISIVYTMYAFYLMAIIVIIAFILGIAAAFVLDHYFSAQATVQARLVFGAGNTNLEFHFIGINYLYLATLIVIILLTGFLSIIIPLLRNVPRSPIKDMREE